MMKITQKLVLTILWGFKKTIDLALENLALRQQLAFCNKLRNGLNFAGGIVSSGFYIPVSGTIGARLLLIGKPETIMCWHRKGFKLFGRFKSRHNGAGWPSTSPAIRHLANKIIEETPGNGKN